jgi:hypothetical protein
MSVCRIISAIASEVPTSGVAVIPLSLPEEAESKGAVQTRIIEPALINVSEVKKIDRLAQS